MRVALICVLLLITYVLSKNNNELRDTNSELRIELLEWKADKVLINKKGE